MNETVAEVEVGFYPDLPGTGQVSLHGNNHNH